MNVALGRKRSRLTLDDDDAEEGGERQLRREPSPSPGPPLGDALKRSKTHCELEELGMIDVSEAWNMDIPAILASHTLATPTDSRLVPYDNRARYSKGESIVVLCVQGNVQIHYELLWYCIKALTREKPHSPLTSLTVPVPRCHISSHSRLPSKLSSYATILPLTDSLPPRLSPSPSYKLRRPRTTILSASAFCILSAGESSHWTHWSCWMGRGGGD